MTFSGWIVVGILVVTVKLSIVPFRQAIIVHSSVPVKARVHLQLSFVMSIRINVQWIVRLRVAPASVKVSIGIVVKPHQRDANLLGFFHQIL